MKELIVATRNSGKLKEIRGLLEPHGIRVLGLDAFPQIPEIVEDGVTFAENALKKAQMVSTQTGCCCLADDSGLVVAALGGEPGVYSARYAGPDADDDANNRKLLAAMSAVPDGQRQAAFCCVMALCLPGQEPQLFEGRVEGEILREARGNEGFGYDPLFWVAGQSRTMAELPLPIKNSLSHRGQALRQALDFLVHMGR
ncbi:MAG: non-canonical purine NTP pyrophosphatase [Desulfuromonas sp.]|nr:MAG: non-canonical purine NTP pyrophosphatase [Desulfuromonas sp.]